MIRVSKADEVPASLLKNPCTAYNGEDVEEQLMNDQDGKCYLCEQQARQNYQIEHLRPKADGYFPELKYEWTNLFLACPYCNGRKSNALLLLDPTAHPLEEIIEQRIDFSSSQVIFTSSQIDDETNDTIHLLDYLHNGENGIRKVRTQQFYKDLQQQMMGFLNLLMNFRNDPTAENKQVALDSLAIEKEYLGLKYWMIKDIPDLYAEFEPCLRWN
jgi:uncharacterized protein (TIGR02646 family)